jgi:hypothetical protein
LFWVWFYKYAAPAALSILSPRLCVSALEFSAFRLSNHINRRIASLRKLIKGGLHQENLDKIVFECNALAQDTSSVRAFFVLKQVFAEKPFEQNFFFVFLARNARFRRRLARRRIGEYRSAG